MGLTCINKEVDSKGKVISYTLQDENGNVQTINALTLKAEMRQFGTKIDNLKLTSDGRLITVKSKNKPMSDLEIAKYCSQELAKIINNNPCNRYIKLYEQFLGYTNNILVNINEFVNGVTMDCDFLKLSINSENDKVILYCETAHKVSTKNSRTLVKIDIYKDNRMSINRKSINLYKISNFLEEKFKESLSNCYTTFKTTVRSRKQF